MTKMALFNLSSAHVERHYAITYLHSDYLLFFFNHITSIY